MGGERAADVHRAVDRVDDDAGRGLAAAERDLAALLADGGEREPRGHRPGLELLEDDVLAAPVELQRHVAALAAALVDACARRCVAERGEELRLAGDDPAADVEPVDLGVHRDNCRCRGARAARATVDRMASADVRGRLRGRPRAPRGARARDRSGGLGADRADRAPLRGARRGGRPGGADPRAHPERRQPRRAARPDLRAGSTTPTRSSGSRPGPSLAERMLRDYALEAGVDPFFEPVGPADRLALMLDRLDELPLRRHEIRGNPAGLLARLLERIDALKAEGIGPAELRDRARAAERGRRRAGRARDRAARGRVQRALRPPRRDHARGRRARRERAGARARPRPDPPPGPASELGERFAWVMADELEDAGRPRVAVLPLLAPHGRVARHLRPGSGPEGPSRLRRGGAGRLRARVPGRGRRYELGERAAARRPPQIRGRGDGGGPGAEPPTRAPQVLEPARTPRAAASASGAARTSGRRRRPSRARSRACSGPGERAPARDLRARPAPPGGRAGWSPRRSRSAAIPFRSAGSAAFFGRPEVRDAIAWLRAIADPGDSTAVVRALTRPPVELRSVDLARCTTIARRRKLDMISALEAALESPQLSPPSRDRIRSFLKLYRAAGQALRRTARRRLRPPPDRADRLPPPRPVRGQPGDRGAAGQPLAARRARRRLGPAPARRLDPRLRPLPRRGRRGRAALQPARRAAGPRRRLARRARAGQGARVRARLPPRARPRSAALGRRAGGVDPRRPARRRTAAARARSPTPCGPAAPTSP